MVAFDKSKVIEVHEDILRRKFGSLYDWEKPTVADLVGPYFPEVFEQYESEIHTLLLDCHEILCHSSDDDIEELSNGRIRFSSDRRTELESEWRALFKTKIEELLKKEPNWAAGGFGRPDYAAEFGYWTKMSRLKLFEVVALSFGVEPKHLEGLLSESEEVLQMIALPLVAARRRAELIRREFKLSSDDRTINSLEFFRWAHDVALDMHPDFVGNDPRKPDNQPRFTPAPKLPDQREIDKIAQLFVAMAIDQLGFDPKAKRSPVPKEIVDLAAEMGLKVSDETVRKYLQLGAKFIPESWQPK